MLSTGLFAQTTPTGGNPKPASPSSTTTTTTTTKQSMPMKPSATHKEETKDQWMKRYNDMKPKLDQISANAKMESKNPEFTAEANKLNSMATSFKSKVDGMDKISADKQEAYNNDLRASHKALNEQYMKVKGMWDKMHPANEKKAEPAKQTPK